MGLLLHKMAIVYRVLLLTVWQIQLSGKGGPSLWTTFHRLKQVHQKIYKEDIRARPELLKLAESFKSLETNREQAELNRLTLDEINSFLTNSNLGNVIVSSKLVAYF